jgi:hypothetical protein
MKITGMCTFSEVWLENFIETAAEGVIQVEYSSDKLCSPSTGVVTRNYL